jgi:hypothetical protein
MNVSSIDVPFQFVEGMSEEAYLEALCSSLQVRVCRVPSNGGCFFDSIYALLPTIGKAVKSPKILRLQIVQFFRECFHGQHGILGMVCCSQCKEEGLGAQEFNMQVEGAR